MSLTRKGRELGEESDLTARTRISEAVERHHVARLHGRKLAVRDAATAAIRELNDWLLTVDDVDVVILSIGDGLTLIRRRS